VLAHLDALGDLNLTIAGEQRHPPHLPQVHPERVVALRVVRAVDVLSRPLAVRTTKPLFLGALFPHDPAGGDLDPRPLYAVLS
jgi:hypothetical protein